MKRLFLLFLVLLLPFLSFSDNIRGLVAADITVEDSESRSGTFKLEDLCVIRIDENMSFLKALELRLDAPDALMDYIKSMQLNIYHSITPEPESTVFGYNGISLFSKLLQKQKILFIQIPLTEDHDLTATYDTYVVNENISPGQAPITVVISPIMKGVPDSLLENEFSLSVKPLFLDQGGLVLTIEEEDGAAPSGELAVFIDGTLVPWPEDSYILDAGIHTLDVKRNEKSTSFSFHIEKGVYNSFTAVIQKPVATVLFELPDDSELFIDGEFVDFTGGTPITMLPGEHVAAITFKGYQTTKKIYVEDGKTYNFSLILDILIEER